MPSIGEKVKYGMYGECVIVDIRKEIIGGREREFFVLSDSKSRSTILVPVEKSDLLKTIRAALTVDEIKALSASECACVDWNADDKVRKIKFKQIFEHDDLSEVAGLLLCILSRQQELKNEKKRLRTVDLDAMRTCEQILYDEFARTIDLQPEDVSPIILGEKELQ